MRLDKDKALILRLSGKSYGEISKALGIPKATLSGWFKALKLPEKALDRLRQSTAKKSKQWILTHTQSQARQAQARAQKNRQRAAGQVSRLSKKDLLLLGTMLYWSKGYKRPKMVKGKMKTYHAISISISQPPMAKIFMRFLRETCGVQDQKIMISLGLGRHQNAAYLLEFWSVVLGISATTIKKFSYNADAKPMLLPYGTVQIRVNSTPLYYTIMGWIDGLAK